MVLPSRPVLRYNIREARKTAIQERQDLIATEQLLEQELAAAYPNVPKDQRILTLANDANESKYEKECAEFYKKKKDQMTERFFEMYRGNKALESLVANLKVKIEDAEQENSPQPIIEDMLAVCANIPAINQALSDHFHNVPADHWQSALGEIRAESVKSRRQILESVLKEMKELVAQDWPQFEADQLRPLHKDISQQNETIEQLREQNATLEARLNDVALQTPAPSTSSAPGPAASRPAIAPTTRPAPTMSARQALEARGQDAADKAEFERQVAEKQKEKEAQLQELMESWEKKEEEDKAYRKSRGWD